MGEPTDSVEHANAVEADSTSAQNLAAWIVEVGTSANADAFRSLYDHFAPRLKGYMMSTGLAQDIAEDIAQDAMANVWRQARKYDPKKAAASTWVFTIARNLRVDRLRKYRFIEVPEEQAPQDQQQHDSDQDVLAEFDQMQQRMEGMPEAQTSMIEMAYLEGRSHGEISRKTGLPLGTVKTRIRQAMKCLRATWEDT